MLKRTVLALAVALVLALGARAADAQAVVGTVLAMGGQCFVTANGARTPLKVGDPVHQGDKLDVPEGAKLKLRLNDGSIISAAAGTEFTVAQFEMGGAEKRDVKLSLGAGLLRAVVAPAGQPQNFEVDTATGVAAVRSTDWFIRTGGDATQVGVLSGVVALTSTATHNSVSIPARWGARVLMGRDPVQPRIWTDAEFDDVINRTNLP